MPEGVGGERAWRRQTAGGGELCVHSWDGALRGGAHSPDPEQGDGTAGTSLPVLPTRPRERAVGKDALPRSPGRLLRAGGSRPGRPRCLPEHSACPSSCPDPSKATCPKDTIPVCPGD